VYPTTLIVADSGPGIAGDALTHLFERFHTNETSNGHGLGLPIARWIIEAHSGTLSASNRPDGGAEFTIAFPKS
jgi:signal transduction histidine kinase